MLKAWLVIGAMFFVVQVLLSLVPPGTSERWCRLKYAYAPQFCDWIYAK